MHHNNSKCERTLRGLTREGGGSNQCRCYFTWKSIFSPPPLFYLPGTSYYLFTGAAVEASPRAARRKAANARLSRYVFSFKFHEFKSTAGFYFAPLYCIAVDRQLPERVFSCEKAECKKFGRFELLD